MKKNIVFNTILIIFIMLLVNCMFCVNVSAKLYDSTIGSPGATSGALGGWMSDNVGVLVSIYNSKGELIKWGIFANDSFSANYKSISPRFSGQNVPTGSFQKNNELAKTISDYQSGSSFVVFGGENGILNKDDKKVLKSLINQLGITSLNDPTYVVVELMIYAREITFERPTVYCEYEYIPLDNKYTDRKCRSDGGTPINNEWCRKTVKKSQLYYNTVMTGSSTYGGCKYEKYDNSTPDLQYRYYYGNSYFLTSYDLYQKLNSGTSNLNAYNSGIITGVNAYYTPLTGESKSIQPKDALKIGQIDLKKGPSAVNIYNNDCLNSKSGGCAIGWYRYSDVIPQKGSISISKKDSVTGKLISSGATFALYKSGNCSGTAIKTGTISGGNLTFSDLDSGTYSVKETGVPSGYVTPSDTCVLKNLNVTVGNTVSREVKNTPRGSIVVTKTNSTGKLLTSGQATFNLHSGENCSGTAIQTNLKTSSGKLTISNLVPGTYSLKETSAPSGYVTPTGTDACVSKKITVSAGGSQSVTVKNTPTCSTRLTELGKNPTKAQLVNLYKSFPNYTNLLNFSSPSCTVATCTPTTTQSCLTASYSSTFGDNNWSCFNSQIDVDGKTGFCQTTFNVNPSSSYTNFNKNNVKSGQMYFKVNNGEIATGKLNQTCYFVDSVTTTSKTNGKISDYLKNVSFGTNTLSLKNDSTLTLTKSGNKFSTSVNLAYLIPKVCVSNISGKPVSCSTTGSIFLGYGILSKFSDSGEKNVNFKLDFNVGKINQKYDSSCKLNSTPEIVKEDKLELEFRIIDTNNPFPGRTGTNKRKIGKNWNYSFKNSKGKTISTIDLFISNTVNSYGVVPISRKLKDPKYTINLNSDDIVKIRKYNTTHKYDDYNFTCNDSGCTSNFLNDLKNGKVGNSSISTKLTVK